jgi:hypothetical protein
VSFLRRWFGRPERPAWAAFIGEAEFVQFRKALETSLRRYCPQHEIDWELGLWRPTKAGDTREFGLMNLAQIFHASPDQEVVEEFIANTMRIATEKEVSGPSSYKDVKDRLRVRLFPTDIMTAPLVTAPVSDRFVTALVADYPQHVNSVHSDDARAWGMPTAELFDIALDNIWNYEPLQFEELPGPGVGTVFFGANEHFYAASHALLLERHLEVEPARGVVVAVPNRHVVIYHPVESRDAVEIMRGLPATVHGLYSQGPGSITPSLLWWRSGQFRTIDYSPDGEIIGPVELNEAIRDLIS